MYIKRDEQLTDKHPIFTKKADHKHKKGEVFLRHSVHYQHCTEPSLHFHHSCEFSKYFVALFSFQLINTKKARSGCNFHSKRRHATYILSATAVCCDRQQ